MIPSPPEEVGHTFTLRDCEVAFSWAKKTVDSAKIAKDDYEMVLDAIEPKAEGVYRSNPFDDIARKAEEGFKETRARLIAEVVRRLNAEYTPNIVRQEDHFVKMLDNAPDVGQEGFSFAVLETFFKSEAGSVDELRAASLKRLRGDAEKLIPYGYDPAKNWGRVPVKREGRMFALHFYTWSTMGKHSDGSGWGYISITDRAPLKAFDSLVLVALKGADPSTVQAPEGYNFLAYFTRINGHGDDKDTGDFYAKRKNGPENLIEAFQFFKNGNLKVWFKSEEDARKVEAILTGKGEIVSPSQEAEA